MLRNHTSITLSVFLLGFAASTATATMFSGSLSSASGQIQGIGSWVNSGVVLFGWEVTDYGTYYHYKYTLSVQGHSVSHFIIEVSPLAAGEDFSNLEGPFNGTPDIDDYDQSNGNPDIPAPLHGLKFDNTSGTNVVFEFDSIRVPVWGDFYTKSGGQPTNQAWNAGLSLPDPTVPAASGSINNHILVPDSRIVPEPAAVMLLSAGLIAMRLHRRRR